MGGDFKDPDRSFEIPGERQYKGLPPGERFSSDTESDDRTGSHPLLPPDAVRGRAPPQPLLLVGHVGDGERGAATS